MFKNVEIKGFRGLKDLKIDDLKRINLFVGENNCGKTSALEAIFLLAGATNPSLPLGVNAFRMYYTRKDGSIRARFDEGGIKSFFHKTDFNNTITISGPWDSTGKRTLTIKPRIKKELKPDDVIYGTSMNNLADSPLDGLSLVFKKGNEKRIEMELASEGVRIPEKQAHDINGVFINTEFLKEDIPNRLDRFIIKKKKERIVDLLKHIEPSLNDIALGKDGEIFCDVGFDRMIPINFIGDGMIRFLAYILAIAETQNGIVLIDEIENGLSRKSQEALWNAILNFSNELNVQVFATTHSIECVSSLCSAFAELPNKNDICSLYRIEKRDDEVKAVSFDQEMLEIALEKGWEVR